MNLYAVIVTLNIKIKAKVDIIFEEKEITNFATVTGDRIFARTSNAIKNIDTLFTIESADIDVACCNNIGINSNPINNHPFQ